MGLFTNLDSERERINKIINNKLQRIYYFDEDTWNLKKKSIARMITYHEGMGECYTLVYFYCLFDKSYQIAHGNCYVSRDGIRKKEIMDHCWCENQEFVYDPTWGNRLFRKEDFYKENQVQNGVSLYSFEEVTENFIKYRSLYHWEHFMLRDHDKDYFAFENCIRRLCKSPNRIRYFYWHRGTSKGKLLTLRLRFRFPQMVK